MAEVFNCSCACGHVVFTATPKAMTMDACHCEMCRKWAGGVYLSVACSDISFEDESRLTVFDSSKWAERVSCNRCGSSLVWRMKNNKFKSVALAAFENADDFAFDRELFIDSRPDNYAMTGSKRQLTEAQIFGTDTPAPEGQADA